MCVCVRARAGVSVRVLFQKRVCRRRPADALARSIGTEQPVLAVAAGVGGGPGWRRAPTGRFLRPAPSRPTTRRQCQQCRILNGPRIRASRPFGGSGTASTGPGMSCIGEVPGPGARYGDEARVRVALALPAWHRRRTKWSRAAAASAHAAAARRLFAQSWHGRPLDELDQGNPGA